MCAKTTPEKSIKFVQKATFLALYWPVDPRANKYWKAIRNFFKLINFLMLILILPAFVYAVCYSLKINDNATFTSSAISSIAGCHAIGQSLVCFFLHGHLQYLSKEMVTYFRDMKPYQREVYDRYVDKYATFYAACATWNTTAIASTTLGALLSPEQDFPLNPKYPFQTEEDPVRTIVFLQQVYFSILCLCTLNSNLMSAILLLFAAGKFEILMIDLENATSHEEIKKCLDMYDVVRKFGQDVVRGVEYMVIITLLSTSATAVFAGLGIITPQESAGKVESIGLAGSSLLVVFMCALPADVLMEVSADASGMVYRAKWYDMEFNTRKTVLQMLVPQTPIVITLKCMMSAMCLSYYTSYVSNAFSFFTTLRIVLYGDVDSQSVQSITHANDTCCNN